MKKTLSVIAAAIVTAAALFAQERTLDTEDFLFLYIKGSKTAVTETLYSDYAKSIEYDTYRKYFRDEFEWADKFAQIKANFDKKLADADLSGTYVIYTNVKLDDYDFTAEGFPVPLSATTIFPMEPPASYGGLSSNSLFGKYVALKLIGLETYSFLKMPKDTAKQFLQSRRNSRGGLDRTVTLAVTYTVAPFDTKEYKAFKQLAESNNYIPVAGTVSQIDVYDTAAGREEKIGVLIQK